MKKPTIKTIKAWDFNQCTDFIEQEYKIKTRDFANSHVQFDEWCDSKGYGKTDPLGKKRSESQVWFAEFQEAEKSGEVAKRPYQDFWHWITDVHGVHRGGFITLDSELGEDAESWQQEILALYVKEFGEGATYHTDW